MKREGSPADDTGHRPQALLLSFFGGVIRGGEFPPVPTAVFVDLLGGMAVAEPAARATLARMTRNGLLMRTRAGRTTFYALAPAGQTLVDQGALRVHGTSPFLHESDDWTLLSYSMPESRRDARHQLRSALSWAGFGRLRDGLWIAPGTVDVDAVFHRAGVDEVAGTAEWFSASPMPGVDVKHLIERAWPVEQIRDQHARFIAAWRRGVRDGPPLQRITLLGADWLQLLRADPGLPPKHLPARWPADRSTATYRSRYEELLPAARRELAEQVSAIGGSSTVLP
jgi:DNA-binding transcriptional regulator PaaX